MDEPLTLTAFAQFCVLCSSGGFLNDVSWVDAAVLEQVRLITLVESEEHFMGLLHEYAALFDGEAADGNDGEADSTDLRRWDEYFGSPTALASASAASAASAAATNGAAPTAPPPMSTAPLLDLDVQPGSRGFFVQLESPTDTREREVLKIRRASAVEERQSLAAALKEAKRTQKTAVGE